MNFLFISILTSNSVYEGGGSEVHMAAGVHRGQKRVSGSLELEVQALESYSTWVLGTKLGS